MSGRRPVSKSATSTVDSTAGSAGSVLVNAVASERLSDRDLALNETDDDESTVFASTTDVTTTRSTQNASRSTKPRHWTPSQYLARVQGGRPELTGSSSVPRIIEFMDASEFSAHKDTGISMDTPLFQPTPSVIAFQGYTPREPQDVTVRLRNVDKVARRVKVIPPQSPYFTLITPAIAAQKVAPGMEVEYTVRFLAEETKDYAEELICITEREKFVLPITAVGARPCLDLADTVNFATCPVKHPSKKILFVRNVGREEANFTLTTSAPFSVSPPTGHLPVGGNIQLELIFTPKRLGSHTSELLLQYGNGEMVAVALYGAAEDVNVRLDKSSLLLESTYITQSCQRTVKVVNRSSIIAKFCWRAVATEVG